MRARFEWPSLAALVVAACGDPAASADVLVVHNVTVEPPSVSLPLRGEVQLEATAWTASGLEIPNRPVSWSSRNPDVATVTADGLVRGARPGRTEIVARADDVTTEVPVSINLIPVAWVVVEPAHMGLKVGESRQLEVFLFSLTGAPLSDREVAFESDDPDVAAVSSSGIVFAFRPGRAGIVVRVEGKEATAQVSVSR